MFAGAAIAEPVLGPPAPVRSATSTLPDGQDSSARDQILEKFKANGKGFYTTTVGKNLSADDKKAIIDQLKKDKVKIYDRFGRLIDVEKVLNDTNDTTYYFVNPTPIAGWTVAGAAAAATAAAAASQKKSNSQVSGNP